MCRVGFRANVAVIEQYDYRADIAVGVFDLRPDCVPSHKIVPH
jgi:hypothetical protein